MIEGEVIGAVSHISASYIKGAAMTELQSTLITPKGIPGDREWVVVQAIPNIDGVHEWVSQRDKRGENDSPQGLGILALVLPRLTSYALHLSMTGSSESELQVPRNHNGREMNIKIWDDVTSGAIDEGDEAAEFLSDHLHHGVRLVWTGGNSFRREVSQKWHPNTNTLQGQDSYPLNWHTEESLVELNRRRKNGSEIQASRFRANIRVVALADHPQESDREHQVFHGTMGTIRFINAKPCDRCPVPLIDQETGLRDAYGEPLATLNEYKRWRKPNGNVFTIFGEGALPLNEGTLNVGDLVVVHELRNPSLLFGGREIKPERSAK